MDDRSDPGAYDELPAKTQEESSLPKIYADEDSLDSKGLELQDGTHFGRKTPGSGGGSGTGSSVGRGAGRSRGNLACVAMVMMTILKTTLTRGAKQT